MFYLNVCDANNANAKGNIYNANDILNHGHWSQTYLNMRYYVAVPAGSTVSVNATQ